MISNSVPKPGNGERIVSPTDGTVTTGELFCFLSLFRVKYRVRKKEDSRPKRIPIFSRKTEEEKLAKDLEKKLLKKSRREHFT